MKYTPAKCRVMTGKDALCFYVGCKSLFVITTSIFGFKMPCLIHCTLSLFGLFFSLPPFLHDLLHYSFLVATMRAKRECCCSYARYQRVYRNPMTARIIHLTCQDLKVVVLKHHSVSQADNKFQHHNCLSRRIGSANNAIYFA